MAKGYINWKLAIVLVVAVCVCVGAALVLHNWQKSSRADQARPLGLKAYEQQNWAEAAKQLGRYLAVRGDDVDILLKYGHAQRQVRPLRANNIDQAISAYSTVLRTGKANADQRYEATRWYIEMSLVRGQYADAETRAAKYLDDTDDPLLRQRLGYALVKQGKTQEAADVLRSLVADHPEHIGAYGLLFTVTRLQPKDFNEPPEYWYEQMIDANPESARAHIEYGRFLLGQAEDSSLRAEAEAHFAQAENLDLSDTDVHLQLIDIQISLRQWDKAREGILAVKAETPKDARLWSLWAKLAIRSQSADEMKKVAEEGLKELSRQPWGFMLWATELFIRTEQFEKASQCIVKLQKVDYEGYRPRINFLEGFLAARQNKWREAAVAYEKAIALGYQSPSDSSWRHELPMVRMVLAEAYGRLGDTSRAIAQLRSYISDTPDRPMAHLRLARLLSDQEEWLDVLNHAREAQRLLPERGAIEQEAAAILSEIKALGGLQGDAEETQVVVKPQTWNDIKDRLAQLDASPDKSSAASLQIAVCRVELALATGDQDEALAILDELDQERPDELAMVVAGLLSAPRREGWSRRESFLKAAVERIEDADARKTLGLRLVQLYGQANQNDRQYELLLELAEQFPDDVAIRLNLLAMDRVRSNTEQAQQIVDKIKSIEGEEGPIWRIEQVKTWMASSDFLSHYTEAVRLLQENIRSYPGDLTSRRWLAIAYGMKGERQLAVTTWKEALERASQDSPDYGLILAGAINALQQAGRDGEADQLLAQARQQGGQSLELPILKLQQYKADGDWSSASTLLSEMVQKDPTDLDLVLELARAYKEQKMFEEAREALDAFTERNPDVAEAWIEKVNLYLDPENEDTEQALNVCNAFVEQEGTDVAYVLRAQTCMRLERYDQARDDFDRAVSLSPKKAIPRLARADFRFKRGQIKDGFDDIQEALKLDPANARVVQQARGLVDRIAFDDSSPVTAWVELVALRLALGQYERAIEVASNGLSKYPNHRTLLLQKVTAESNNQDWSAADLTLETLLNEDPNDPIPVLAWADLLIRAQQWNRVGALVERWRSMHPNDASIPARVALSLVAAGSPEASQRGAEIARAVLESHPKHLMALHALANVMITSSFPGDQEEAAQLNRRILQIDPNDVAAMNNLAWVLSETMGQQQEALDLVNRGLEMAPQYADMLDTRGVIHLRMGQFKEAERDLARCVELYEAGDPGAASLPAARLHLAKAYAKLGRETEATQQLRQALDAQEKARQTDPPVVSPMSDEDEAEAKRLLKSLEVDVDG